MEPLEERMRQFTEVVKFGMSTGQIGRNRKIPNFARIASEHFGLDKPEYQRCYFKAQHLLEQVRKGLGLTSDDMIRQHREAFKKAA